jgi:hypothetical protein
LAQSSLFDVIASEIDYYLIMLKKLILSLPAVAFVFCSANADSLPSFPGAEGFGALATGGRGGEVYHVTNLDDSGPGSFRDAVSAPGRTVVFDVGGIVQLKSPVACSSNLTIAGQTAPGEGIMLLGHGISFSGQQNVICRYLKLRAGIGSGAKTKVLNVADGGSNMIFDHLSIAWGRWDNIGFTQKASNLTIQNCIIGEAIDPQWFGALIDSSTNITVARNLWINHSNRNPKGKAHMQFINNVIYNWRNGGYGGGHSAAEWNQDLINNYFIKGPTSNNNYAGGFDKTDLVFLSGNLVDLDCDGTLNGREINTDELRPMTEKAAAPTIASEAYNKPPVPVTVLSPSQAYEYIAKSAGSSQFRDKTDQRLIAQLTSLGKEGQVIKDETEVGGPGELKGGEPAKDSDRDGMPDEWEKSNSLDPSNAEDGRKIGADGYSNLEKYLSSIVEK